jgi:hypothetical protein
MNAVCLDWLMLRCAEVGQVGWQRNTRRVGAKLRVCSVARCSDTGVTCKQHAYVTRPSAKSEVLH